MDWIKNFFVLETSFNNEWWFLAQYIIIVLMLPFLFTWLDRKKANPWTDVFYIITGNILFYTVIVPFVNGNAYLSQFASSYYWSKVCAAFGLVPMFLIGAYMAKCNVIEKILNYLNNTLFIKLFGVFGLWIVFELRENWQQRSQWGWDQMDFIYAAFLIIIYTCLLDRMDFFKKILNVIGKHSTGIWLIHSFFCYYYCQEFIYAPQNPILIYFLLLFVSFVADWIITWLFQSMQKVCKQYIFKDEMVIQEESKKI